MRWMIGLALLLACASPTEVNEVMLASQAQGSAITVTMLPEGINGEVHVTVGGETTIFHMSAGIFVDAPLGSLVTVESFPIMTPIFDTWIPITEDFTFKLKRKNNITIVYELQRITEPEPVF